MFWNNEYMGETIAIDTETEMITSPGIIPKLILATIANSSQSFVVMPDKLHDFLNIHHSSTLYFYNAAFDLPVIEQTINFLFEHKIAYDKVIDAQILYRLHSIATLGKEPLKWNLKHVAKELVDMELDKDESIRLTFGSELTEEHYKYAVLDAVATYKVTKKLLAQIATLPTKTNLAHKIHLMGDLALAQVTRNGIHIDRERVTRLRAELEIEKIKNEEIMATYGYVKGKKGNTKVLDEYFEEKGFELPQTATGKVKKTASTLKEFSVSGDKFIEAYLAFKGFSKVQNFLNDLDADTVHPRYNTLKVTGRVSCTRPNIQQMPRVGGIREAFIAKPGHVFIDCDYNMIELVALSAVNLALFGSSKMGDIINEGADLHRYLASKINNCTEEEVTKDQRQFAKVGNFGFGADMGIETFVSHAAKNGYDLTMEQAKKVKEAYLTAYPEMKRYFDRAKGRTQVVTDTGFVRNDCKYTEFLNCAFQTKVAEGAKISLYLLNKAGFRVVGFIHDQFLVEHPIEGAEEALETVKEIMITGMSMVIKGVKVAVTGEICGHFKK